MFNISDIRNIHLFGIPLFDTQGNPFSDALLQSYLDSAIAWAEQTLNICIYPRDEEETHDYFRSDYQNWAYLKLWKKPVLSVESLELYYGERPMMKIPNNWIKIDTLGGAIQLFPSSGTAGSLIIGQGGGLFLPIMSGTIGYAPQLWKIKYKAGMNEPNPAEKIYRRTDIHPNLKEVIYKKAGAAIMTVWGDLIIGAGIANQSISIDGLSQSIGTTQSAMFGGASARIKQMLDDIDNMMPALKSYYSGIELGVV